LSISVRLKNLIRGGLGLIWAVSAIEEEVTVNKETLK
jgi:hypothetical protein